MTWPLVAWIFGVAFGAFFTWIVISVGIVGDALDSTWQGDDEPLPQRHHRVRKTRAVGKSTASLEILPRGFRPTAGGYQPEAPSPRKP